MVLYIGKNIRLRRIWRSNKVVINLILLSLPLLPYMWAGQPIISHKITNTNWFPQGGGGGGFCTFDLNSNFMIYGEFQRHFRKTLARGRLTQKLTFHTFKSRFHHEHVGQPSDFGQSYPCSLNVKLKRTTNSFRIEFYMSRLYIYEQCPYLCRFFLWFSSQWH